MKVNVLGTEYSIINKNENDDEILNNCDGYCDKTEKKIVICKMDKTTSNLGNLEVYRKKVLRHEIVHAFLFESGLHENGEYESHSPGGHPEQIVDWIAIQFPKMLKAFKEVGAL